MPVRDWNTRGHHEPDVPLEVTVPRPAATSWSVTAYLSPSTCQHPHGAVTVDLYDNTAVPPALRAELCHRALVYDGPPIDPQTTPRAGLWMLTIALLQALAEDQPTT